MSKHGDIWSKSAFMPPQFHFYRGFFIDKKRPGTSFYTSFVILHKLTKFRHQTVFTSQVIQEYTFLVSRQGI